MNDPDLNKNQDKELFRVYVVALSAEASVYDAEMLAA
jgi:hypothetical protein